MVYKLKDNRTGACADRLTTVEIKKDGNIATFFSHAENTQYYCPYDYYNGIHSAGDACEILIGTDPERKVYYEMEISAKGQLMLAKMTNNGDVDGEPMLDIDFVEVPFITSKYTKLDNGYNATISFDLKDINTGDGDVYFNAYRLETDGEYRDKYLYALNPTLRPKFHVPDKFLYLKDYV
jgi:hypothetical protein